MYREESVLRKRAEEQLRETKQERLERASRAEIASATLQVENLSLRGKLRRLEGDSVHAGLFEAYESEVGRLEAQNKELRQRNARLELQHASSCLLFASSPFGGGDGDGVGGGGGGLDSADSATTTTTTTNSHRKYRRRLRELHDQVMALQHALHELKRGERRCLAQESVTASYAAKVPQLSKKLRQAEDQLNSLYLSDARAQATIERLHAENEAYRRSEEAWVGERVELEQQARALKARVLEMRRDGAKYEKIARFIEKHTGRPLVP